MEMHKYHVIQYKGISLIPTVAIRLISIPGSSLTENKISSVLWFLRSVHVAEKKIEPSMKKENYPFASYIFYKPQLGELPFNATQEEPIRFIDNETTIN